jgi:single-strand DNA-binding protein
MNKVVLVGRLTKDPELKRTNSDIAVVQFTIAVNRTYQNKAGEKQADFIGCVAWRAQAENLAKYMRKGSLIGIDGQIQTRNYDDQNGVRRYITEVICDNIHFLESKSSKGEGFGGFSDVNSYEVPDYSSKPQQEKQRNPFEDIKSEFDISNDDLPF